MPPLPEAKASETDAAKPERIYADSFLVWIYAEPQRGPAPIGYLRGGQSLKLRAESDRSASTPVRRGCGQGWYAVEPAGYVCLDRNASLHPTRYSLSMQGLLPAVGPFPFDYALSMGSPSYRRAPSPSEWTRQERRFGEAKHRPLPPHWRGHEELITELRPPSAGMPPFLRDGASVSRAPESRLVRREVPFGSMLAVTGAFEQEGRQFLQSADGTVVPVDRFRMFKRSQFEGVDLAQSIEGTQWQLPLAWPRKRTRAYSIEDRSECAIDEAGTHPRSKLDVQKPSGKIASTPRQLKQECLTPLKQWKSERRVLSLSGRAVDVAGTRFVETNSSEWLPLQFLFLAEERKVPGSPNEKNGDPKKWIHFRIGQGTLVTYQGERPTFATLASPGIGGVPARGADPLSTRTTPVGTYRIQFKHWTDDMSPEQTEHRDFWIADVPFAMYFKQPFAIHVAYWHESFGEPMSGGCINVSPKDGARLFAFSDPPLPAGWYGVGASKAFGYGTTVVIDR